MSLFWTSFDGQRPCDQSLFETSPHPLTMSVYPNTNNYPLGHTLIMWVEDCDASRVASLAWATDGGQTAAVYPGPIMTNTFLFINDTFATNLISSAAQRKQPGNDNTTPLMGGDVGYWN
ncbi:hypothetical protein MCOR08_001882 [Pyricularia oryzae]|nr:hypothetical protein MCOR15_002685 [Pyricularia oryzae]KAI6639854.1 hypothetical protein MCOR08_001882 [Pyricularia oryzae]